MSRQTEARKQSNLDFRFTALGYKFRDLMRPRLSVLEEVGIKPGFRVLDYGCGPGSYILPLAGLVGESGVIYALDVNPLAILAVRKIAAKKRLRNVHTILTECQTELPPDSLDVVLLYDILHDLDKPAEVLAEINRVLKPGGTLSVSDHHLKKDDIEARITEGGMFRPSQRGRMTYSFSK